MCRHILVALIGIISAESGVINVNLNENSPIGSDVTQLRKVIDSQVPFDVDLEFRIVKQDRQNGLELFDIVGSDGVLKLKQTPDREILCPRKKSCVLGLQIVVLPPKYYQDLSIEVTIIDENDNKPSFQHQQIELEIMENTRSSISLDQEMAYDPDLGDNGQIVYSISDNDYFTLEQYKDQVGEHLDLVPKNVIDREKTNMVSLQLQASNPTKKQFFTTIPIVIKVLDQNEHTPTFNKKEYEFTIDETVEVGTTIGKVGITDGDGADSIQVSIRDLDVQQYFHVTPNGEILTNKKLDFEKNSQFDFWLVATDSTHSARAHVIIHLRDINDNAPILFITFTNPHKSVPNAGWVDEEGPIGMHVAYVRAEDIDSFKNGQTHIRLLGERETFELTDGILTTRKKLDREETSQYKLEIEACDSAKKRKCTVRRGVVFVRDLNDNYPICGQETFHATISEATEIGAYVTRIDVTDNDSDDANGFGTLQYFLEPTGVFTVDSNTGVIILTEPLDYETQPTWQLVTLVRDGGGFETRCHLVVEVEDANEAAPVFQQPTDEDLELLINSDEPEGTYLMTVIAIDPDFNPENSNGAMHYSLAGENEIIQIDSSSGEVFLNTSASSIVDEGKTFRVIITATDSGIPAMSSTIKLTVAIRDGVISGLVQDRRAIKGGATLALIAILAALTALLILVLIAVVFICRHRKIPNRYTCGNITTGTTGPSSNKQHNPDGVKIHDDVSILYDSVLTPRSSIVPSAINRIDLSSKLLQSNPLEKICQRHQKREQMNENCRSSAASDSDHADSGKGESDQDTLGQAAGMGPRCNRQCLRYGHSDACWIDDDASSCKSSEPLNISSISLPYDNRTNIIHSHNPSLHQNPDSKKDVHSSGYISQEDGSGRMRVLIQSTPIKSLPSKPGSSSSAEHAPSTSNSSLIVSSRPKHGCIIDVRGSDRSSDLTVRDLTMTRSYTVSPRVNIV